ncbi:TonB-dependent receptor [Acinetobacter kanungonis]|uniref:hypothetical protein n=1 Tax=Acinetobacter kanungonis TaxID=2699469 RepID=UPI0013797164|nr:hypothetical protein [Acinetobacter kanungonis]NCI76968.1 hypothetical protein [Acinetobacter kanungonis]
MIFTKSNALFTGVSIALFSTTPSFASDLALGDANTDLGKVTISGWLRANIQDKDYSDNDHKLQFNAAKINVNYDANKLFGNFEYRCYQFDTLCDFSSLVNANLGYKFNDANRVTVGVQDVPFGPGRGWSTSWYGGIDVNAGLEDIHNLGLDFQSYISDGTKIDLAYFVGDAGNYVGKSYDSSRYTVNYVKTNVSGDSSYNEKNMFVGRIDQQLPNFNISDLNLSIGGSYWHSEIENLTSGDTGSRNAWAAFARTNYKGLNITLTGGKNKITNKDPISPDYSVMGSFDSTYYVANDADFYTADLNYVYKDPNQRFTLTPYLTYSSYVKNKSGYKDSTRNIIGAQLDVKQFSMAAEYIIGKNDVFINGSADSLAAGDDNSTNRMLNLLFFYNF